MWQLKDSEGRVIRANQPSAWEACHGMLRASGAPIRRRQVIGAKENFFAYEKKKIVDRLKFPIVNEGGIIIGEAKVPSVRYELVPYLVEKIS